jgi:hypothetical protein
MSQTDNEEIMMPRPTRFEQSAEYRALNNESLARGERRDCTVIAVAVVCSVPYDVAHSALTAAGRRAKRGTHFAVTRSAIEALGYKVEEVPLQYFIGQYPKPHRSVLKSVTSHHPDRFPQAWADGKTYLLRCAGHVLAVVNGVNMDWSRGKALRVHTVMKVTKKEV